MILGTIKMWKEAEGWGFIEGDDTFEIAVPQAEQNTCPGLYSVLHCVH